MAAKFSILTPVFNEERYLEAMIGSVHHQSHTDWELILVDDGSADRTVEIAESWCSRDPRVRLVSKGTKLGKVAAFNLAHSHASGQFLCHVGGDDLLPEDSLTVRAAALEAAPAQSVLLGKLQVIDSRGAPKGEPIPRGPKGSQSGPGATYTRDLAARIFPIPSVLPSEDIWLGNAAVGCADQVIHSQAVHVHYRMHQNNSNPRGKSFSEMTEAIHSRMRAIQELLHADGLELDPAYRRTLRHRWELEERRYARQTLSVLGYSDARLVDRLANASMANPTLWTIRKRLGVRATGWRGR